ncbi:hypothetical protein [Streptomyces sp. KLOTTS4A1]|uniref:hypothetical protein n=1 Tax=Streptomyces sp. KLOTTS4A1 TaxID=3390996 RepID=UPI0039F4490E
MASTTSTDTVARRRTACGVLAAGLALPLVLTACSADAQPTTPAKAESSASQAQGPSVQKRNADHTVRLEAALTRQFDTPSLAAFAGQPGISNVISGTVTATRSVVTGPENTVETILTLSVERQRNPLAPKTVQVREQGGIVTVEQVRSDFEGKLGRQLTKKELAETVEYVFNGIEPASTGDRVLIVVADDTDTKGHYIGLARLKAAAGADAAHKSSGTEFGWPGKRPNSAWEKTVDADALLSNRP